MSEEPTSWDVRPSGDWIIECPQCPNCGRGTRFMEDSTQIYGGHRNYGPRYWCQPCDTHCGTHPDGRPLGTPANAALRRARSILHETQFDPLWQNAERLYGSAPVHPSKVRGVARTRAYRWLAHHMGLPEEKCHIAMLDLEQCRAAYRIILDHQPTDASIRDWCKAREEKEPAKCRSCSAPVWWVVTDRERRMPIDAATGSATDLVFDPSRHTSHFATCVNAAQHRRKR